MNSARRHFPLVFCLLLSAGCDTDEPAAVAPLPAAQPSDLGAASPAASGAPSEGATPAGIVPVAPATELEGMLLGQGFVASADGRRLVIDGQRIKREETPIELLVFDLATGKQLAKYQAPDSPMFMAISVNGERLAIRDDELTLWDLRTGQPSPRYPQADTSQYSYSFTFDGAAIVLAEGNMFRPGETVVRRVDVVTGNSSVLQPEVVAARSVIFSSILCSPTDSTLAIGRMELQGKKLQPQLVLYDLLTNQVRQSLVVDDNPNALGFSADGRTLAVGSMLGNITIIDPTTGTIRATLTRPSGVNFHGYRSLAVSGDGAFVAVVNGAPTIVVWDVAAQTMRTLGSWATHLAFLPGNVLIAGTGNKTIVCYDATTGAQIPFPVKLATAPGG